MPENNAYGYFRYNDAEAVFVFINNSDETVRVPWTRYAEISAGLAEGRNVLTGEAVTVSDETQVEPCTALVVEFKRK